MKNFFRLAAFATAALLSFGVTGCSDDDENPKPEDKTPVVELEADEAKLTDTSVGFVVTAKDASAAAWVILPATDAAPSATEIFKNGTAVKVDAPQSAEAVNLTPETAYTVYAAAARGEVLGKVASLNVTTLKKGETVPVVVLTMGKNLTATSADFEVTATNATAAAWVILPATDAAPAAAEIIKNGTKVEVGGPKTAVASDLTPETSYTVYAAAANGEVLSKVAELDFTTLKGEAKPLIEVLTVGKNYYKYRIDAAEGETYMHIGLLKQMYDNFLSMSTTDEERRNAIRTMLNIYGFSGSGPKEYENVDMTPDASGFRTNNVYAGMPYTVVAWKTKDGQPVGDWETAAFDTEEPANLTQTVVVTESYVRANQAAFDCAPEEGVATFLTQSFPKTMFDQMKAEGGEGAIEEYMFVTSKRETGAGLSEWINLDPESDYVFAVVGIDENGDRTPLIEHAFTTPVKIGNDYDLEFTDFVSGSYYGKDKDMNGNDVYIYTFTLADCEMAMDNHGMMFPVEGAGNVFITELFSDTPADAALRIPENEYVFGEDMAAGTWSPDTTYAVSFDAEGMMTDVYFIDGIIGIEDIGDAYFVNVELVTADGNDYFGIFEGDITLTDEGSGGFSNRPLRKVWSGRRY